MAVRIKVTPASALVDENVAMTITGLNPGSTVTIRAEMKERKWQFESHAHYIADMNGHVNVCEQPSVGGSYIGIEPMGLFWSMQPSPGQQKGIRFMKSDVHTPVKVTLSLHNGFQDISKMDSSSAITSSVVERWYKAKDVERIPVRVGRIRGVLFKPKGRGLFPGVIDMFGSFGGLLEFRASLLASRGFVSLALPFIGYDDLPSGTWELELEYFKEASEWLSTQPYVVPNGIGVIGVSLGAQLALTMAAYFPETVRAVVSISGPCVNAISQLLKYKGEYITPPGYDASRYAEGEHGFITYTGLDDIRTEPDHVIIPVEKARHLQFIVGKGDLNVPSLLHAQEAVRRLQAHGHKSYELLTYPGAGHLIEPPYSPFCRYQTWRNFFGINKLFLMDWGGNMVDHARAQEDAWLKMLQFLRKHIGQPQSRL